MSQVDPGLEQYAPRYRFVFMDQPQQELADWQAARLKAHHDQFHPEDGQSHGTRRIWNPQSESLGQYGQLGFALLYGLDPGLTIYRGGDGRVDFVVHGHEIDVKSQSWDYGLAREATKPHAEILVLCEVNLRAGMVWLKGWEFDKELVKIYPLKQFRPDGPENHVCETLDLKPMYQLEDYLRLTADERKEASHDPRRLT